MRNFFFFLLFSLMFFISRMLFLNPGPVFFDSPEYISRLGDSQFFSALSSGHIPLHAGYILVFWPVFHLAQMLHLYPMFVVQTAQIILALLGILAFFKVVQTFWGLRLAIATIVFVSFIPILWITQETVMMETVYVSCFLISWYFFIRSDRNIFFLLAILFFALSLLTHLAPILYLPPVLFYIYSYKRKLFKKVIMGVVLSIFLAEALSGFFVNPLDPLKGLVVILVGHTQEHASLGFNLHSILIAARNIIVPTVYNYTLYILLLALVGIILMFFKDKKLFVLVLLFLTPIIVANQWWDSLLFGRHALISSFGIALAVAFLVVHVPKYLRVLIFVSFVFVSGFSTMSLMYPSPYELLAREVANIPPDALYIESHFARPQIEMVKPQDTFFVDEPSFNNNLLPSIIDKYLRQEKKVFISSQVLSEPYGHFEGPYLHPLSLSYRNDYRLSSLLTRYNFRIVDLISQTDNIIIYEISSSKTPSYPTVYNLRLNSKKIDNFDPFSNLFWEYAPI